MLSIKGVDFQQFVNDRRLSVPGLFDARGVARMRLVRDGRPLERDDPAARASRWTSRRLLYDMFAPLIFWLMGTVVIIFLRPRDERWLVLILFSYVTALWIASGFAARTAGAAFVFHAVIWFFLPLSVHLHMILPSDLLGGGVQRGVQVVLYCRGPGPGASSMPSCCSSGSNIRFDLVHAGGGPALRSGCSSSGSSCRSTPPPRSPCASCCSA